MNIQKPNQSNKIRTSIQSFKSGVLDLRFKKTITMELLPLFYAVLLLVISLISIVIIIAAFWFWIWAGLISLVVVPLGFVVVVAVVRVALEYLVLAFHILETVNNMNRIPEQVDNLNAQVNYISGELTDVITDVGYIRNQVDHLIETLDLLKPLLVLLTLPKFLVPRHQKPSARF